MSETDNQHGAADPSMEDILASIRRILNDGEGGAEPAGAAAPPHDPPAEALPTPHAAGMPAPDEPYASHADTGADDVFVLDQTMLIEEPKPMQNETTAHEPPHEMENAQGGFGHADSVPQAPEPLLAPSAAAATTASLGALVRVVSQRQTPVYRGGPTLEDMVREEIRPIVKAWLDDHLAPMVERMVRAEIERVISRASL